MAIMDPRNKKTIKEEGGRKNKDWKKRWKTIVEYDQDWDWRYFLDIILHKLYLIQSRYTEDPSKTHLAEEELEKIRKPLAEVIAAGERIRKDDYDREYFDFFRDNCDLMLAIKEVRQPKWKSKEAQETAERLRKEAAEKRKIDIDIFFGGMADHFEEWWD